MDDNARLQLHRLVQANNVEDQTGLIRELRHSEKLRNDINTLLSLKRQCGTDVDQIHMEAIGKCEFLFNNYTDLYNKVRKDEIDLSILFKFLDVLAKIENGELDQHEGSFEVGTLLKKIYIDSALRKAEKLDELHDADKEEMKKPQVQVTWKQYKTMRL